MHTLHPHKTALAFAAVIAGVHLIWALLVFFGVAESLVNFIFWAHMLGVAYIIKPFELTAAVTLIAITALSGYLLGYGSALAWNAVHKR